jgi:hypothetical protein
MAFNIVGIRFSLGDLLFSASLKLDLISSARYQKAASFYKKGTTLSSHGISPNISASTCPEQPSSSDS